MSRDYEKTVKEVGRKVMGTVGWVKSLKGVVWAAGQAGVTGALMLKGFDNASAVGLGAIIVVAVNTAFQFIRIDVEIVER